MTAALNWLVSGARPDDHLLFHYSGHGSQQRDKDGDEGDGKDETIVPCDYQTAGMMSDDELRRMLVLPLPEGCRLTCIFDCCHSGTQLDLPYRVILKAKDHECDIKKQPSSGAKAAGEVVMISGCMDNQTSADIGATAGAKASGAMTSAFKNCITRNADISYHQLLVDMRKYLSDRRFAQVPQLTSEHFINLEETFLPEASPPHEEPPPATRAPVRRALTIGCNYLCLQPGHGRLSGCINDSETMTGILKDTFHFEESQICRLRDDRANMMPTKDNMLKSMHWLTKGAQAGDEMFFHYSGHGGQQKDTKGDEEDGKDETLIPCDFQHAGMITDDELHTVLVDSLPKGARLWVILDCCHSGTALDLPFKAAVSDDGASMTFKKAKLNSASAKPSGAEVIMLSGCKDTQTSGDVSAGSLGLTKAAGAMTTAFRHAIDEKISCEDLMLKMRHYLKRNSFVQVPQMSSEQFITMESSFVGFAQKRRNKRDLPAYTPPPGGMPMGLSAPPSPMNSPMGGRNPMASPVPEKVAAQIAHIEDEIAMLRAQQNSPMGMPGSPLMHHPQAMYVGHP
jgi:hypothetical protein